MRHAISFVIIGSKSLLQTVMGFTKFSKYFNRTLHNNSITFLAQNHSGYIKYKEV